MFARRETMTWAWCLALVVAASCSVFPDQARLPRGALVGAGGAGAGPDAGSAGSGIDSLPAAGASPGAGGGAPTAGGEPGSAGAAGSGEGGASAGAGGCANSGSVRGAVTADTWIEAANPNATHGKEARLSVVGGGSEQRGLLQLSLPAVPNAAVMLKASLTLHLEANADGSLASRQLELHGLDQDVDENRASWVSWSNGNRKWTHAGGDFGAALAEAVLPAGTSSGALSFDVTLAVQEALAKNVATLPFIVVETGAPPPAPADLAFGAREGNASHIAELSLEYCEP